jgi:multiple sugar transport system ATP-binding protein
MRVEMRREILQLHRRIKTTMIYVTHDQVEAMTLGDRICVMRDGVIEQVGEPTQVFDNPATLFVARFIGAPPMNILDGKLVDRGGTLVFDGGTFTAPIAKRQYTQLAGYAGKPICLGVRPKAFVLRGQPGTDESCVIKAKVEVAELLGEEVLAHLSSNEHQFTVSTDPHSRLGTDQEIEVCPLMDRAHLFDVESGKNLTLPPGLGA